MEKTDPTIHREVAAYYTAKLVEHGPCPRGVDWNGEAGQILRFRQLAQLIDGSRPFSVNDLGCGYGAFLDYLQQHHVPESYAGIDLSREMIRSAEKRFQGRAGIRFLVGNEPDAVADYGIASGIFNVRLGFSDRAWRDHVEGVLEILDRTSQAGFAFNALTAYADADKMRPDLYYADPCALFDLCKRRYARNVSLLHDYDLYEFTLLVRKRP